MILYSDIDPKVCAWLAELVKAGHLPHGEVRCKSIVEMTPDELRPFEQVHHFAGIGGWPLALRWAGWAGPAWSASCPCQPFSSAGRRKAEADDRHLWPVLRTLIAECRPPTVFGEQVASSLGRAWLSGVRADLEALGYRVGAADLCAASVGAPHIRQRLWWVADTERRAGGRKESCGGKTGRMGRVKQPVSWYEPWPRALSRFRVVDDGLPRSVVATDAARNAIVPQVAAAFVTAYMAASQV